MSDTSIIPQNTTLINVFLKNPNGHPLTRTRFIVKPIRAGFWNDYTGVVEDKEELYSTDENGYVQLHLWPLPYPYMLTYSYDDNAVPGYFMFYVPDTTTTVNLQDLIVAKVNDQPAYGEEILAQIIAAKAQVTALVDEAKAAESGAQVAASVATTAATKATENAQLTDVDREHVNDVQLALQAMFGQMSEAIIKIQGINLQNKLLLGGYQLWVDAQGRLRIKNGAPTSDTDGTVVGTQTS
ncbi:tail protein [Pectobacterium phage Possum]|uniref:Tail fiber protein n=1 Tax=Pectobacterium phage Possum TaxID=2686301 RepID=A0A7T0LVS0_9CAUD|nr:tail protein [Pectobacterium phage Possum]QPL10908.1 tail fiber protein [Pectobacterium phage Possum]QPL11010.1 tail fiber protein [Pectobacterium phage Horatius]